MEVEVSGHPSLRYFLGQIALISEHQDALQSARPGFRAGAGSACGRAAWSSHQAEHVDEGSRILPPALTAKAGYLNEHRAAVDCQNERNTEIDRFGCSTK